MRRVSIFPRRAKLYSGQALAGHFPYLMELLGDLLIGQLAWQVWSYVPPPETIDWTG